MVAIMCISSSSALNAMRMNVSIATHYHLRATMASHAQNRKRINRGDVGNGAWLAGTLTDLLLMAELCLAHLASSRIDRVTFHRPKWTISSLGRHRREFVMRKLGYGS